MLGTGTRLFHSMSHNFCCHFQERGHKSEAIKTKLRFPFQWEGYSFEKPKAKPKPPSTQGISYSFWSYLSNFQQSEIEKEILVTEKGINLFFAIKNSTTHKLNDGVYCFLYSCTPNNRETVFVFSSKTPLELPPRLTTAGFSY